MTLQERIADHGERQALTPTFIDHRQPLQLLILGACIEYEVTRPDVLYRRPRLDP